jgi:hypothetical protein
MKLFLMSENKLGCWKKAGTFIRSKFYVINNDFVCSPTCPILRKKLYLIAQENIFDIKGRFLKQCCNLSRKL